MIGELGGKRDKIGSRAVSLRLIGRDKVAADVAKACVAINAIKKIAIFCI